MMSKLKYSSTLLRARRTTCLPSLRHPAYRQRELHTGDQTELVNLSGRCQEKIPSWRTSKEESIDVSHGGGATRSSADSCGNAAGAKGWHYLAIFSCGNCSVKHRRYNAR